MGVSWLGGSGAVGPRGIYLQNGFVLLGGPIAATVKDSGSAKGRGGKTEGTQLKEGVDVGTPGVDVWAVTPRREEGRAAQRETTTFATGKGKLLVVKNWPRRHQQSAGTFLKSWLTKRGSKESRVVLGGGLDPRKSLAGVLSSGAFVRPTVGVRSKGGNPLNCGAPFLPSADGRRPQHGSE